MTDKHRKTLVACINLLLEQAATLRYWQKHHGHGVVANPKELAAFAALVEQVQPYLEAIEGSTLHQQTDADVYDNVREVVEKLTTLSRLG